MTTSVLAVFARLNQEAISSSTFRPPGVSTERPGSKRAVGVERPALAVRAGLEEDALAVVEGAVVEVARERPGPLQARRGSLRGRSSVRVPLSERASELADTRRRPARAGRSLPLPSRIDAAMALISPSPFSAARATPSIRLREAVASRIRSESSGDRLGGDPAGLGQRRGVGLAGADLDDLGADDPLRGDLSLRVRADEVVQPLVDPEPERDRPARRGGGLDPLDDARVDPLHADAVADVEPADRRELGAGEERRLHPPLPLRDHEDAQPRDRQGRRHE